MSTTPEHRARVAAGEWPPRCDCCAAALCRPSDPGPVLLRSGVGLYCNRCHRAIDAWTGGYGLPSNLTGLPGRCPEHLPEHRLTEIREELARRTEVRLLSRAADR